MYKILPPQLLTITFICICYLNYFHFFLLNLSFKSLFSYNVNTQTVDRISHIITYIKLFLPNELKVHKLLTAFLTVIFKMLTHTDEIIFTELVRSTYIDDGISYGTF